MFEGEYDGHPIAIKQITCADIETNELQDTCFELVSFVATLTDCCWYHSYGDRLNMSTAIARVDRF